MVAFCAKRQNEVQKLVQTLRKSAESSEMKQLHLVKKYAILKKESLIDVFHIDSAS